MNAPPDETRRPDPDGGEGRGAADGAGDRDDEGKGCGRVLLRGVGVLLLAVAVVLTAGLYWATRTDTGRQAVVGWVEDAVQGTVRGQVEIGRLTGGNLLTRAELSGLSIREHDGEPFLVLEDVRAEYDPLAFLRGRFVFRDVRVGRGRIYLLQDDDGSWNFDRLFADTADAGGGQEGDDGGTHLSLHDVRIESGRVDVRTPYDAAVPDSQEIWRVERTPEGRTVRTITVDSLSGRFPRLRIADPDDPMFLDLEDVSGRALVVRQPLALREASLQAVFRDTIRVRVVGAGIGESRVSGDGWVSPEDPPQYRFELRAEPFSFGDLQWVPVPMPAEGGGSADVTARSEGEDFALDVRSGDVRIADSRIRGALTLVAAATPRIDTLDVDLAPLRLSRVDRILGRPTRVDGYVEGLLRGGGPIDSLALSGDLTVRDTSGDDTPSRVRLDGAVSLEEPNPVHDLRLRLEAFRPKWAGIVTIRPEIGGRVRGTVLLDGTPAEAMTFRTELVHRGRTDSVSRVRAEGRVADYGEEELRVDVEMSPLALDVADRYLPEVGLTGAVRGTLRTTGDLSRLRVNADLSTRRGAVSLDGSFGVSSDPVTYDARVRARGVQLQDWLENAPYTQLVLQGNVQGVGTDPGELEAEFDMEILPSIVEGAVLDTSRLRFSVDAGLATVDSFDIRSDVGRLRGRGAFGLEEGRSGSLVVTADVPRLATWNRWLVPGRNPVRRDTSVADLFEGFPDVAGEGGGAGVESPAREPAVDTLAGRLTGRGVIYGNVTEFAAGGMVRGDSVSYGVTGADSLAVTLDLFEPERLDSLVARADAWGVRVGEGTRLDSVNARLTRRGAGENAYRLYAGRDTTVQLASEGFVGWEEEHKEVRLDALRVRLGSQQLRLERPATVDWGEDVLTVGDLRLTGQDGAEITAAGALRRDGEARFDLQVRNIEAGLSRLLYSPEEGYGGSVDGALQIRGTGASPRMSGFLTVSQPQYAGVAFDSLTANFQYRDRTVDFRGGLRGRPGDPLLTADGTLRANLSLQRVSGDRLSEDPLDVRLSAEDLPLRIVELATESLEEVRGVARGDLRITGSPGSLRYEGRIEALDVSAYLPALGLRYGSAESAVQFRGAEASLDELTLSSSLGGTLTASGTVGLARLTDPDLDLELTARKLRAIDRRTMRFTVDGSGTLTGSYAEPFLQGTVRVSNGEVEVSRFMQEREVVDLTEPDAYSLIDTTLVGEQRLIQEMRNPFLQNLRVQAQLQVGPDFWLRSQQLDVELAGQLRVRMQPDQEVLQLFGPLRLVRGQFRYSAGPYTRQLQIAGGTIEFVGTPGVNPNLNITARYQARGPNGVPVNIEANVGGTLINKTLTLSSDAQLSESDQICYLLFSSPCVRVAGPSAAGGGGLLAQTLQEQLLGSVGSQLTSMLVADTWLDYASVQTNTLYGSGVGTNTDFLSGSFFSQAEVEAGKYLGQNVFVSVTQPLGSRLPGATLEWQFRQNWTLEARTENRFGRGLLSLGVDAFDAQRMWGVFLFREWGF